MPNSITANVSYYRDQLARDGSFQRRLATHMLDHALVILAEALNTQHHLARVLLARRVLEDSIGWATRVSPVVVTHANFTGNFTIADGNVSNAITELNMQAAVIAMWNQMAGVETGV